MLHVMREEKVIKSQSEPVLQCLRSASTSCLLRHHDDVIQGEKKKKFKEKVVDFLSVKKEMKKNRRKS